MKVKELIAKLAEEDPEADVIIEVDSEFEVLKKRSPRVVGKERETENRTVVVICA